MRTQIAVFWGAIALLATPSSVLPAQQAELFDRFSLWTGCETMRLVVQELGPDAADIDLSAGSLQATAEARLRAARLYTDKTLRFDADDSLVPISILYVDVDIVGAAFTIQLRFFKPVHDPASDLTNTAVTWFSGSSGTHGRDSTFILGLVSRLLDEFLVQYLRVNEAVCRR